MFRFIFVKNMTIFYYIKSLEIRMKVFEKKVLEVGSRKIVNDAPDGDVGCDSELPKDNEGDYMDDCHRKEDKYEYYATVEHGDVDLGNARLNVEVSYNCDPNLDNVANLLMKRVENKKDPSDKNVSSGILISEESNICNPTSSIARILRARTDMLRKIKDIVFMTTPNNTRQLKKSSLGHGKKFVMECMDLVC